MPQNVCLKHPLKMDQKSVNLQYNTLVRWADGTNDSSTKRLMFQVSFFFIKSCKILCKNPSNLFFYKITKMKIKSFECPKSIRNYEKKNTWNVRRLVNESFVPLAQRTSVLYCRLSDLSWLELFLPNENFISAIFQTFPDSFSLCSYGCISFHYCEFCPNFGPKIALMK